VLTGTLETPMKRYDLMNQVNARGTFLCSQKALPYLKKADNPHILNTSPPLNMEPRWFGPHVAYSMAKFGMSMCVLGMAEEFKGKYILVLEGGIPTAENGVYCTIGERYGHHVSIAEAIDKLAPDAAGLVAVGACAAFGGIPSGKPNPTKVKGLADYTGRSVVNVPGCPAHPDWVVGTLVHLLHFGMPELDKHGRPLLFYGKNIHENCPNYSYFTNGKYAQKLGDEGCLVAVGCKGPMAFADCPLRHWNSGVNWCIGSGTGCIACCEPGFPDDSSPMYAKLPEDLIPRRIV